MRPKKWVGAMKAVSSEVRGLRGRQASEPLLLFHLRFKDEQVRERVLPFSLFTITRSLPVLAPSLALARPFLRPFTVPEPFCHPQGSSAVVPP